MATKKKVASKSSQKAAPQKKKAAGSKVAAAKKAHAVKKTGAKPTVAKKAPLRKPVAKTTTAKKTAAQKTTPKSGAKAVRPAAKKTVAAKPAHTGHAHAAAHAHPPVHANHTAHSAHSTHSATRNVPAKTEKKTTAKVQPIKSDSKFVANKFKKPSHTDASRPNRSSLTYQPEFVKSILDQPEQNSGPVYRYSDSELQEFREIILKKLETAKKELSYLQGLITRKDETGTDDTENKYMSMEDGSGTMEREQLNQMASRQIQFIDHLEKALMRIENKTYGICRVTGKLIDKARLRAVPHATLSIEAKQAMNK